MEQNTKNNFKKLFTELLDKVSGGKNYSDLSPDLQSKADDVLNIIKKIEATNPPTDLDTQVASLLNENREYYKALLGNNFDAFEALFPEQSKTQPTTTPTTGIDTSTISDLGKDAGAAIKTGADTIKDFSKQVFTGIGLDEDKVGNWGHLATGVAAFMALGAVTSLSGAGQKLMSGDVFGAGAGVFGVVKSAFMLGIGALVANCFFGKENGHDISHNRGSSASVGGVSP